LELSDFIYKAGGKIATLTHVMFWVQSTNGFSYIFIYCNVNASYMYGVLVA
jgi:hypothetical protein